MKDTQHVQERLSHGKDKTVRSTLHAIEVGSQDPPALTLLSTQHALEEAEHPVNQIWICQTCIEVAWPSNPPPPPPPGPGENFLGANNAMLLVDLSGAQGTMPDYGGGEMPEYA